MSYTRIFRWRCDFCPTVAEREQYKLPPGWHFMLPIHAKGKGGQNACAECAGKMPESWRWEEQKP
jgi:hypothetical protein